MTRCNGCDAEWFGLRAEIADRANVEQDLRAQVAQAEAKAEEAQRHADDYDQVLADLLDASQELEAAEAKIAAVTGLAEDPFSTLALLQWQRRVIRAALGDHPEGQR